MSKRQELPPFDKYYYYSSSVQAPEADAEFLDKTFQELHGTKPTLLREDFGGTFANCCSWVQRDTQYKAISVDLDPEPLEYGKKNYLTRLKPEQQERISVLQTNVLNPELPKADIICALNFSYSIFKERAVLLEYFKNAHQSLNAPGYFICDIFGGPKCMEANEEETEHEDKNFSYFWDQDSYDYLTNHAQFYIHFKRKGEPKRERVFSYDWRLWSPAELRDIMTEAGFDKVVFYIEGTDDDGDGNGVFTQVNSTDEECESWIAYVAGVKF